MGAVPPTPLIATPSLTMRPLELRDAEMLFRHSREHGMRTWLPSQVYRDRHHAQSVVAFLISQYDHPGDPRIGPYVLGVQLRESDELVGHVGLSPWRGAVEAGFAIAEAHQRKGYATEAVLAVCRWACDAFSLESILGVTAIANVASQGVLARAGFVLRNEEVMEFQGSEQRVRVFAFS
jgi:RimJ/RimL family protein N-acetyltransferase